MRLAIVCIVAMGAGAALLLAELPWFSRRPLLERLRPHSPQSSGPSTRSGFVSVASFRDVVGPLAHGVGERLARLFGVREDLAVRLDRIHSGTEPADFRVRQATWATVGFVGALLISAIARPPIVVGLLMLAGGPLLGFLVVEQNLSARSAAWQRRITLELPVVSEQLAMLLGSGYSLGAALNRLASRGTGACATDLRRVCGRIRQGLSEHEALREWAAVAGVPALDRLVSVLALNRQATDLGRLVTQEARSIRRDLHREVVAVMERRSQQVWIPVTVATLVPGVVFLCIPFIEALRQFTGS
jgi:tight adherence protein C